MIDREANAVALFSRFAAIPGIITASRFFRAWAEVGAAEQPALFMVGSSEEPQVRERGLPTVWKVKHKVFLYTRHDPSFIESPAVTQNGLLSALESALEAQAGEDASAFYTTLGGKVSRAYISDPIVKDEGTEGGQGVAVFSVEYIASAGG